MLVSVVCRAPRPRQECPVLVCVVCRSPRLSCLVVERGVILTIPPPREGEVSPHDVVAIDGRVWLQLCKEPSSPPE